jgi:hypothetical protein
METEYAIIPGSTVLDLLGGEFLNIKQVFDSCCQIVGLTPNALSGISVFPYDINNILRPKRSN